MGEQANSNTLPVAALRHLGVGVRFTYPNLGGLPFGIPVEIEEKWRFDSLRRPVRGAILAPQRTLTVQGKSWLTSHVVGVRRCSCSAALKLWR